MLGGCGLLWRKLGSPSKGCNSNTDVGLQRHLRAIHLVMQPLYAPGLRYAGSMHEAPMVHGQPVLHGVVR